MTATDPTLSLRERAIAAAQKEAAAAEEMRRYQEEQEITYRREALYDCLTRRLGVSRSQIYETDEPGVVMINGCLVPFTWEHGSLVVITRCPDCTDWKCYTPLHGYEESLVGLGRFLLGDNVRVCPDCRRAEYERVEANAAAFRSNAPVTQPPTTEQRLLAALRDYIREVAADSHCGND